MVQCRAHISWGEDQNSGPPPQVRYGLWRWHFTPYTINDLTSQVISIDGELVVGWGILHNISRRWINDRYVRVQLSSLFLFVILAFCWCRYTGQWQPCVFPCFSVQSQAGATQTKCPGSVPPEQKGSGTKAVSKAFRSLSSVELQA